MASQELSGSNYALPKVRILGRQSNEAVVEIDGLRMFLNPSPERFMDKKLLSGELWEHKEVQILCRIIRPGMTILDVGANFGYYTLIFSKWVGDNGRVIAFEPTSEYGNRLIRHIRENNLQNVRLEMLGLSDSAATCQISVGECSATIQWVWSLTPRITETIQLVTLDSWWQQYLAQGNPDKLDFVKVDTDGHEPKFLLGARQVLIRHRPIMLMEFFSPQYASTGYSCEQVAELLEKEFGYELCSVETGKPFDSRKGLLEKINNEKLSCDILCVPREKAVCQHSDANVTAAPATVSSATQQNPQTSTSASLATSVVNITPAMLGKARELVGEKESQAAFFILMSASEAFVRQAGRFNNREFGAALEHLDVSKIRKVAHLMSTGPGAALTYLLAASAAFADGNGDFDACSFNARFNDLADYQFMGNESERIARFFNTMRPVKQETLRIVGKKSDSAISDSVQLTHNSPY
jgi:FkbM family methyltransferase